jgi:glycosyltransferase involved in cell wall biosynthesis
MISVLIPTKNEELDLPGCLASVAWSDDIHVYDSGSTDRTAEIAEAFGANVTRRQGSAGIFGGNEAEHKTWALRNIPFKHPWVFQLDADERVSSQLKTQLLVAVQNPGAAVAFRVQRRDFLGERWLKHVQATSFYTRLFRPDRMQYQRRINPVSVPNGPTGDLSAHLEHFPFSKGMRHWLDRHNWYSTLEAQEVMGNRDASALSCIRRALVAHDVGERRAELKRFFYHLPMRPVLKFAWLFLAKRGFLDGRAGLTYAILQTFYEYMICLKVKELSRAQA